MTNIQHLYIGIYVSFNGVVLNSSTYLLKIVICTLVIKKITTLILPGVIPQDGQWLRPDEQPVNCIDVTPSDPFQCTDNGTQNDAKITLYLNDHNHFGTGAELQYKCCLPTNSDPTTNIMIINVFGKYIRSN